MPAAKGKKVNVKSKEVIDEVIVHDNKEIDEVNQEDSGSGSKVGHGKSRAIVKKGKAFDSKKDEAVEEIDDAEPKNGKGVIENDEEVAVLAGKPGPRSRGKLAAKKPTEESGGSNGEEEMPVTKKITKRGVGAGKKDVDDADPEEKQPEDSVKPKKLAKKDKPLYDEEDVEAKPKRGAQSKTDEVVSTRRGGDRAVKKSKGIVDEPDEKPVVKKGRGAKTLPKNGVAAKSGDAASSKEEPKKRGRQAKKGKEELMETESDVELSDVTEKTLTVAVEHCKS